MHFSLEAKTMSLKYRGISYDASQPSVELLEEVIGRYRGAVATRHISRRVVPQPHPQGLIYRGVKVR